MKKVWILNSVRWNSAISEYALNLSRALKDDYSVTLSLLKDKPPADRASRYELNLRNFDNFGLNSLIKFKKLEREIDPDIVICFSGPESFLARFCSNKAKIIRFRGRDSDVNKSINGFFYKFLDSYVDSFLFPSNLIAKASKLSNKKYRVIYLGCDNGRYRFNAAKIDSKRVILAVGRLDPIKGYYGLLDLYKKSFQDYSEKPLLRIIGKSANIKIDQLESYAKEIGLNLGEEVEFISDFIPDVEKYIAGADLGVVSSIGSEVICRVSEEFLLSGVPVVLNDVGSLSECLIHENFGNLINIEDMETASKILQDTYTNSIQETDENRKKRAELSSKYFSFKAMKDSFNELVQAIS